MRTITDELVPLHSLEAEMSALGSMLFGERPADEVFAILDEEDFYRPAHREIFKAMRQLQRDSKAIDLVTLKQELVRRGSLEDVGGEEYLIRIAEFVPSPANAAFYAQIVQENSTLRKLEGAGHEIVKVVRDPEVDLQGKINKAEAEVYAVGQKRLGRDFFPMRDLARDVMLDIDTVLESGVESHGLMSGFYDLDDMTTGFYPGDFVIVAARPAMGKTSLVLRMALNVAEKSQGAVAVFSIEMSAIQLARRLVSMLSRVNSHVMKKPSLEAPTLKRLADACEHLYSLPLYIDESSDISAMEMLGKCRRLAKEQHGLSMVVVDYLQLMRGHRKSDNRVNEVSDIARALKNMAKELKVPVVALSQLSRGVEQRDNKRPQLSDLRESGSIEAEADMVMFIYREQYYKDRDHAPEEDTPRDPVEPAEIIIAKHRNGPTGTVRLGFEPSFALFSNLAR